MKLKFTKLSIIAVFAACFSISMQAQVTIGSGIEPHNDALLDLKEDKNGNSNKGILLPRVSLKATDNSLPMSETNLIRLKGMTVYNLATDGTGDTAVTPGVYYHDGTQWVRMGRQIKTGEWFYMPAIQLDASSIGQKPTEDLYDRYEKQFTKSGNPYLVKNAAAPDDIPTLEKDDLYYYITYYDNTIFDSMSISDEGVLSYSVIKEAIDPTFITVVFVAK